MDFAGVAVDDRDALAGIVDKELLPRAMALPHDQVELAGPGAIRLAKPAILEALRRGGLVFLPQQEQGDALAFELVVHRGPVGGQGVTGPVAGDGGNSRCSNVAASSPSGRGQDKPATWARCTYAATVGRLRPRLRAICRSLSPPPI